MAGNKLLFSIGDIVFAKIKGIRHWPAVITEILYIENKSPKFEVCFFGDNTTARVKPADLSLYSENCHLYGVPLTNNYRNCKFNKALKEAELYFKGNISSTSTN